jgi:hypothetical protein
MHGRKREREGNLKLGCGGMLTVYELYVVILTWQRPLWKGD